MDYFLGVDIGNTKSHALIADQNGRCLGFGAAGAGSWEAVGWGDAQLLLQQIVEQAIKMAGINKGDIHGAGFGYAGYDWPEDREGHVAMIASLGLENAAYTLGNDTLVGLVAGAKEGWGVVVVAGTSNNCRGRDKFGRQGRVTGSGTWFGEYGGATEIINKAIQAVAADWTFRGPQTALSDAFMHHVGAVDKVDLLAGLIRGRFHLNAADAPIVFQTAAGGDVVARAIITWAGESLGGLANAVIGQLDLADEAFDVVLSGSLYKGGELLIDPMRRTIHNFAPDARLVRLNAPPVIGGVLLGMEAAGLDMNLGRDNLMASVQQVMVQPVGIESTLPGE